MNAQSFIERILSRADIQVDGPRPWDIQVHQPGVWRRLLLGGSLALGESYMEGAWDCVELDQFFTRLFCLNFKNQCLHRWYFVFNELKEIFSNRQSKSLALRNGQSHYDRGNDLYLAMLDSRMVYTCADWRRADNLDDAQEDKLQLICEKLQVRDGMRILDVGCGWGSFLKYAAQRYDVQCVGITISAEQAIFGRRMCAGLPVEIRLQDYRDVNEPFDRIVSLGMLEHVGPKNYRTYMEAVHRCLVDNGIFVLQTIGSNASSLSPDPWLDAYIFPGAKTPSIAQLGRSFERLFVMEGWENAASDYDRTLMAWFGNFDRNWPQLQLKYGEQFYRMWKYYLLSCAALFRARRQQLWRIVLCKNPAADRKESDHVTRTHERYAPVFDDRFSASR